MSNPFVLGTHKFETLDALRGIAALAVVEYHATALSAHAFRHGYLAVDFFFVLSGFVLSYAYGDRLAEGWSTASFMKARFIRLWPLNTLGLLLGLLLGVAHHPLDAALLRTILLNLIFLPSRLLPHGSWFPVNPVAWTLFFELFSNLFHVLFLRRARSGVLIAVVCLSGAVYAQRILVAGSADIGINVAAIDGFARVLFSYGAGMLLFRLWRSQRIRLNVSPLVVAASLVLLLGIWVPQSCAALYDLLCIVLLFPSIVLCGAFALEGHSYSMALQALGAASYAIYVLQSAVLTAAGHITASLWGRTLFNLRPWSGSVLLPTVAAIGLVADRYFDLPVRRLLRRRPRTY